MDVKDQITLDEAIRVLEGAKPFMPPAPAERLAEVFEMARQKEREAKALDGRLDEQRRELEKCRGEIKQAQERIAGLHQSEQSARASLSKAQADLASLETSVQTRRAMLGTADQLLETVQKYITLFRP